MAIVRAQPPEASTETSEPPAPAEASEEAEAAPTEGVEAEPRAGNVIEAPESIPEGPAEVAAEEPPVEEAAPAEVEEREELPAPPTSEREADVEAALRALAAESERPEVAPGPGAGAARGPGRVNRLQQDLARWARLWRSQVAAKASEIAERRSQLEQQNEYLKRTLRRLPRDVRRRKVRVQDARVYRKIFQAWAAAYDRAFDGIEASAKDAPGRAAAYRRKLELAQQTGASATTVQSFAQCLREAERIERDLSVMSSLVLENVDLCSQILNELDFAIDEAQRRALSRRSEVRVTTTTFATLGRDIRRLVGWFGERMSGAGSPRELEVAPAERPGAATIVARMAGIIVVGALFVFIGRRVRKRVTAHVRARMESAPEGERECALWRCRLGINILRTVLVAAFLLLGLLVLELPRAWHSTLAGVVTAWCGYYVARLLLRLALSPRDRDFRLVACDDAGARRLFHSANVLLAISAVFLPLMRAFRAFEYEHSDVVLLFKIVYGLCLLGVFAWLTYVNSRRPILQLDEVSRFGRSLQSWIRFGLPAACGLALGVLVLLIPGYVNLSAYLARSLALTAVICAGAAATQEWIRPRLAERFSLEAQPDEPAATGVLLVHYGERVGLLVVVWLLLMSAWEVRAYHIEAAIGFLSTPLLNIKGTKVSIVGLVNGALVIIGSYCVARFVRSRVERSQRLSRAWDQGARYATGTVLYYGIFVGGIVLGILVAGLQLNILVAFAGMVGIAVGFGSQDIAKNIICGLIILVDRSINVGDFVDVAGQRGVIEGISVRSTTVRTPENRLLIVPNSTFYSQNIVVSSQRDRRVRLVVDVAVAADTDFDAVCAMLLEVARSQDRILAEPAPQVMLSKLAANALNLQLTAWTDYLGDPTQIQNLLVTAIWRRLKESGVAIV